MKRLLVLTLGLAAAGGAMGQGMPFHDAVDGKSIPAVIKPKDLPADYWAVKIVMTGEFNFLDLYGPLAFSSGFDSGNGNQERRRAKEAVAQAAGVFWTKGEKVAIEGHPYLIAYRLDIPIAALGGNSRGFDSWAMENPLELTLQLIRPDAIGRMSPVPSLSPEKMAKAIATFERAIAEAFGVPVGTKIEGATNMPSKQTAALSNVKQISLALLMYGSDYDDLYPAKPSIANLRKVVAPYMKNDALWKTGNPKNSQFMFNPMLYGVTMTDVENPAQMPMIYESVAWPDGRRAVGYSDGHAKLVSAAEWSKLEPLLRTKIKRTPSRPPPKKRVTK